MNLDATRMEVEQRSIKHMSNRTLNATGSVAEFSSLNQHDSKAKNSSEKLDDEDDFRVPTFVHSGIGAYSEKDATEMGPEKLDPFSKSPQKKTYITFNSSLQCSNANDKPSEQTNTFNMKSRNSGRNQGDKKRKETLVIKELKESSVPHQELGEKSGEPSNIAKMPSGRGHTSNGNVFDKSCHGSTELCQEPCGDGVMGGPRSLNGINSVENQDASRARNDSTSKPSLGNSHRTSSVADRCSEEGCDEENGTLEMQDAEKKDEASDASMVDSISGLEVSPCDVVEVFGPKHFWKARRAIAQ